MRTRATVTISLPPEMIKDMERVQKAEHRTRSELVREALRAMATLEWWTQEAVERATLNALPNFNQHGVREAKFPDTAGDLGHLGLRMRPRVARVGDQSADFPPFDSDLSRARARAGVAGVKVSILDGLCPRHSG